LSTNDIILSDIQEDIIENNGILESGYTPASEGDRLILVEKSFLTASPRFPKDQIEFRPVRV